MNKPKICIFGIVLELVRAYKIMQVRCAAFYDFTSCSVPIGYCVSVQHTLRVIVSSIYAFLCMPIQLSSIRHSSLF